MYYQNSNERKSLSQIHVQMDKTKSATSRSQRSVSVYEVRTESPTLAVSTLCPLPQLSARTHLILNFSFAPFSFDFNSISVGHLLANRTKTGAHCRFDINIYKLKMPQWHLHLITNHHSSRVGNKFNNYAWSHTTGTISTHGCARAHTWTNAKTSLHQSKDGSQMADAIGPVAACYLFYCVFYAHVFTHKRQNKWNEKNRKKARAKSFSRSLYLSSSLSIITIRSRFIAQKMVGILKRFVGASAVYTPRSFRIWLLYEPLGCNKPNSYRINNIDDPTKQQRKKKILLCFRRSRIKLAEDPHDAHDDVGATIAFLAIRFLWLLLLFLVCSCSKGAWWMCLCAW